MSIRREIFIRSTLRWSTKAIIRDGDISGLENPSTINICSSSSSSGSNDDAVADDYDYVLVVVRLRRSRSAAAYSDQTFPWTMSRSVGLFSALWKNGGWDPDAVWHHRSDGSRDEAGSGVWGSAH